MAGEENKKPIKAVAGVAVEKPIEPMKSVAVDKSKTHANSARTKIGKDEYMVRRRAPRRPVDLRIGLLYKGEYNLSKAHEIGEGGALIECQSPLKISDRVLMTIRIPGVLQGVIISTVVYAIPKINDHEPIKYGIQFDQIEFDLKRKMRNYVASSEEAISTHIL